jgi:Uma2 family endonuclease
MNTVWADNDVVHIPPWVCDVESFRRWAVSDEAPQRAPVFFLDGEVWVDMSKEQLYSHGRVKQEFFQVLGQLTKRERLGEFFPDGHLLSNEGANLSGNPDGTFVSNDSFRDDRVRLIEGASSGFVELEGSPDMVLEVVSDSSVEKDTELLSELYWKAEITEYWQVDARGKRLEFEIFRHTSRGFSATRKLNGWLKSNVFGRSFRLTRETNELGHPEFTLEIR